MMPPMLNHYHRPILEICDTLISLFALLLDANVQLLADGHHRAQRHCELIHVENLHALKLSDLAQWLVHSDDWAGERAREAHELLVDPERILHIGIRDFDWAVGVALELIQDGETAAPARAASVV